MKYFAVIVVSYMLCTGVAYSIVNAAFNDVTLTTNADILVNGINLNISGSSAVIESMTVNATDFTLTLASGSSISINAPGLNRLDNNITSDVTSRVCTSVESSLTLAYSGGGTVTNTITPSATLCNGSGESAPSALQTQTSSGGGFTQAVWMAFLNMLFGPEKTNSQIERPAGGFLYNLQVNSKGSAVADLQAWLISHGYDIPAISTGKALKGFFGSQTQSAVMRYQKDHGIPATGFFGPLTRASLNGQPVVPPVVKCPEGYICRLR